MVIRCIGKAKALMSIGAKIVKIASVFLVPFNLAIPQIAYLNKLASVIKFSVIVLSSHSNGTASQAP
jgi:hypothetical protein